MSESPKSGDRPRGAVVVLSVQLPVLRRDLVKGADLRPGGVDGLHQALQFLSADEGTDAGIRVGPDESFLPGVPALATASSSSE